MQEIRQFRIKEEKTWLVRYLATGFFAVVLLVTVVFSGLAGAGGHPFSGSTGDVSDGFDTCVTPADYTFAIWGVIYFFLFVIAIYAIFILFWKIGPKKAWEYGGAVSVPFLLVLSLNLIFNIGWLFAWDARDMTASYILLLIIVISNITALVLALMSFAKSATALFSSSKFDFWMGIVVLNGHVIYVTWTIHAHFINLGILIITESIQTVSRPLDAIAKDTCLGILSFLFIAFIIYFIVEQVVLKRSANPIFLHYSVYLWAMIGIYVKNRDRGVSKPVVDLMIVNITSAVILLVLRIAFLAYRNRKNQMYSPQMAAPEGLASSVPKEAPNDGERALTSAFAKINNDGKNMVEKGGKIRTAITSKAAEEADKKVFSVTGIGLWDKNSEKKNSPNGDSPPRSADRIPPDVD